MSTASSKTGRMTGTAILAALVVVLTVVATFVKFGPFPITLTLIPIVVGAAMYGPGTGAGLGTVFGAVVLLFCINGADPGGNVLWIANPALTAALCLVKGAAAGFASGLVYAAVSKKDSFRGVVFAAIVSPVVNTGIFLLSMVFCFHGTLVAWAGGASLVYYLFIGLAGVNFLLELILNVVLSPTALRIIRDAKKR